MTLHAWLMERSHVKVVQLLASLLSEAEDADAFLGTQGYVWDTQSDMALALLGAVTCLLTIAKIHDKQLSQLNH